MKNDHGDKQPGHDHHDITIKMMIDCDKHNNDDHGVWSE